MIFFLLIGKFLDSLKSLEQGIKEQVCWKHLDILVDHINWIALIYMYIDLVKQLQSAKMEKVMLTLSK